MNPFILKLDHLIDLKSVVYNTVNVLKFSNTFHALFSDKILIFGAGFLKTLVRIKNREDPNLGLPCLSRPFHQAISVQNFTFTVVYTSHKVLSVCLKEHVLF